MKLVAVKKGKFYVSKYVKDGKVQERYTIWLPKKALEPYKGKEIILYIYVED